MRNTTGKQNQGLILLDQYFSVPQIGEVIRDLLFLQSLAQSIQKRQLDDHLKTRKSKDSLHSSTDVAMIPEEDMGILDVLKMTDPTLVQSLLLLKNNTSESQLTLLLSRAKNMTQKYN